MHPFSCLFVCFRACGVFLFLASIVLLCADFFFGLSFFFQEKGHRSCDKRRFLWVWGWEWGGCSWGGGYTENGSNRLLSSEPCRSSVLSMCEVWKEVGGGVVHLMQAVVDLTRMCCVFFVVVLRLCCVGEERGRVVGVGRNRKERTKKKRYMCGEVRRGGERERGREKMWTQPNVVPLPQHCGDKTKRT